MRLIRAEINGKGAFVAKWGVEYCMKKTPSHPGPQYYSAFSDREDNTWALVENLREKFGEEVEVYHVYQKQSLVIEKRHVMYFNTELPYRKIRIA